MMNVRWMVVWLFALALGCTPQGESTKSPPPQASPEGRVVTEWRPQALSADAPKREVGESCVDGGDSACMSGRCVHAPGAGLGQGYFCTKACSQNEECPAGWPCAILDSNTREGLCQPRLAAEPAKDPRNE